MASYDEARNICQARVVGTADAATFPLQKKRHTLAGPGTATPVQLNCQPSQLCWLWVYP